MNKIYNVGLLLPIYFQSWSTDAMVGMADYAAEHRDIHFIDMRYRSLREIPSQLKSKSYHGLVTRLDTLDYMRMKEHLPLRKPIVNIYSDVLTRRIPSVCVEPQDSCQVALDYFMSMDLNRIALFGKDGLATLRELDQILARLCDKHSISYSCMSCKFPERLFRSRNYPSDPNIDEWLSRVSEEPVGIITTGGYSATLLQRTAGRLGLEPAEQVAILSITNDETCLFADPPISALRSRANELGIATLSTLYQVMLGGKRPVGRIALERPEVLERRSTLRRNDPEMRVRLALNYMRNNACRGITVEEALRQAPGVSRVKFYELVEKMCGVPPGRELRRMRMDSARQMLRHTELNISEIAEKSGYHGLQYFSDAFRAEFGISPSAWRKQNSMHGID